MSTPFPQKATDQPRQEAVCRAVEPLDEFLDSRAAPRRTEPLV